MKYLTVPVLGRLPRIALGCDRFGADIDEKTAFAEIETYFEHGGYVLDTAHAYGLQSDYTSTSEITIGKFLKTTKGEAVFVATKGGITNKKETNLTRTYLLEGIEKSLDHLGQVPNLWYFHRDEPSWPVEELMETAFEARKKGLITHIGASNWTTARIEEANRYALSKGEEPFVAVENQFSLAYTTKEIWGEKEIEIAGTDRAPKEWFIEHKMPCFCFSSQGRGILQKLNAGKTELGKASRFLCPENVEKARVLKEISLETGISETDLVLAYVLNQKAPFIAIIGSYNVENIQSSLQAADLVLTPEILEKLEA